MEQSCIDCGQIFIVTPEDEAMLQKLSPRIAGTIYSLPPPTHCPDCRYKRRLAMRNENKLYQRTCDKTGKQMISLYAADSPYTAYSEQAWYSDTWDPLSYGKDINLQQPFFQQFDELRKQVPRRGMHQDGSSENCQYTTYGLDNKNCYLSYACAYSEDVYHSTWHIVGKNCTDCLMCIKSELLYECIDCTQCYECRYCQDCLNCQQSAFLENCHNCHHCIGCKNLRNQSYHVFNKPVSEEEYRELWEKICTQSGQEEMNQQWQIWRKKQTTVYAQMLDSEGSLGNNLEHAHNCYQCFDVLLEAQDCRHCQFCGWKGKDMMDCSMSGKEAELLYEVMACANMQQCCFIMSARLSSNLYYCEYMKSCEHCFGCIGLSNKKYCILNKQYTQEDYERLVPSIIEHMRNTKEYGEHFPMHISAFPYNDTLANERFALTQAEAIQKGLRWQTHKEEIPSVSKTIPANQLPNTIDLVPDDVLNWAIICQETEKPFRLIEQELRFYREQNIPLPHLHPETRQRNRASQRLPHKLWQRSCSECQKTVATSYHSDRPEPIVCEGCFLKDVY